MLFKKENFPEEGELVLCTTTNIQSYSIFARLDEYTDKTGMIHISEIAAGRVRNIRDYVKEGKLVVCKVLRINRERGHIDLSLRRVAPHQQRLKLEQIKQEQKSNKLVEHLAKELEQKPETLHNLLEESLLEHYDSLFIAFMDVVNHGVELEKLGLDKTIATALTKFILERLKPEEVTIAGNLSLSLFTPDGVELLKKTLGAIQKDAMVQYLAAGNYKIIVKAPDYKVAEKKMEKLSQEAIKSFEKAGGIASFSRKIT